MHAMEGGDLLAGDGADSDPHVARGAVAGVGQLGGVYPPFRLLPQGPRQEGWGQPRGLTWAGWSHAKALKTLQLYTQSCAQWASKTEISCQLVQTRRQQPHPGSQNVGK